MIDGEHDGRQHRAAERVLGDPPARVAQVAGLAEVRVSTANLPLSLAYVTWADGG